MTAWLLPPPLSVSFLSFTPRLIAEAALSVCLSDENPNQLPAQWEVFQGRTTEQEGNCRCELFSSVIKSIVLGVVLTL